MTEVPVWFAMLGILMGPVVAILSLILAQKAGLVSRAEQSGRTAEKLEQIKLDIVDLRARLENDVGGRRAFAKVEEKVTRLDERSETAERDRKALSAEMVNMETRLMRRLDEALRGDVGGLERLLHSAIENVRRRQDEG